MNFTKKQTQNYANQRLPKTTYFNELSNGILPLAEYSSSNLSELWFENTHTNDSFERKKEQQQQQQPHQLA